VKTSEAIVDALKKRTVTAQEADTLNTTYFFTHWYPSLKRIRVKQVGLIKREKLGNKFVGAEQTISDNEKSNGVDSAGIDLTKPQNGNSTWAVLRGFLITVAEAARNATGLSGAAAPEFGADKSPHIAQLPDTDLVKTLVREDENIAARFSGRDIDAIQVLQMKAYSQSYNIADAILQSDFGDKFLDSFSIPVEGDEENVNEMLSKINRQECTEEQTFPYDFQHAMHKVICPFVKGVTNESSAQSYETAAFQAYNSLMSVTVGKDDASIPEIYRENLDDCKHALKTIESDSAAYIAKFSEVLKKTASVELQAALDEMRTDLGAKFRDVVYDFLTNAYTIMVDEKRQPATEATGTEARSNAGSSVEGASATATAFGKILASDSAADRSVNADTFGDVFIQTLNTPHDDGSTIFVELHALTALALSINVERPALSKGILCVVQFATRLSSLMDGIEKISPSDFKDTITDLLNLLNSVPNAFSLNEDCSAHFENLKTNVTALVEYMSAPKTDVSETDYANSVREYIESFIDDATEMLERTSCIEVQSTNTKPDVTPVRSRGTQVVYTVPKLAPTVSSMEGAKRVSKQIQGGYYGLW